LSWIYFFVSLGWLARCFHHWEGAAANVTSGVLQQLCIFLLLTPFFQCILTLQSNPTNAVIYVNTTLFAPLHSSIFQPTGSHPQEDWYISWAGSTNLDKCHVTYNMLLFNFIFTSEHTFCWACLCNVSVPPADGPVRATTCRRVMVWIK